MRGWASLIGAAAELQSAARAVLRRNSLWSAVRSPAGATSGRGETARGDRGPTSLATRYALASGVVLVAASLVVGAYVTRRIEDSVVRNAANTTALYTESFLAPIGQQLAHGDRLSDSSRRTLEEIFEGTSFGQRIVSYKIWKKGGVVVEASDRSLVGRTFDPGASLRAAWGGQVHASFEGLGDDEDEAERSLGVPLLEIYSPIREVWSGEVIAVAEFYEINEELRLDLISARRDAWVMTGGAFAAVGVLLYLIVLGGSRTIERQRRDIDAQYRRTIELSDRNAALRLSVQNAAGRAAASTEAFLRRIGADLHDGPAQYLAFAALRLDDLRSTLVSDDARHELDNVSGALTQAMSEIRSISRGLSLPELKTLGICDVAQTAVEAHERRTNEQIGFEAFSEGAGQSRFGLARKICVYRFVQEGLNNASRHAGGRDVMVTVRCLPMRVVVSVADGGPGLPNRSDGRGLGLPGLRDRIESLGGRFWVSDRREGGAEIRMELENDG